MMMVLSNQNIFSWNISLFKHADFCSLSPNKNKQKINPTKQVSEEQRDTKFNLVTNPIFHSNLTFDCAKLDFVSASAQDKFFF